MQVTANDIICIAGELAEQRSGAWTATVEVDDEDGTISGAVTIKVGEQAFKGTVVRGEVPEGQGRWVAHIVGGAGGLEKEIDCKHYFNSTLLAIAKDALSAAGETLDAAGSDLPALAALMPRWTRTKGKARLALSQVAQQIGGFWRVTRAGKVIIRKTESWKKVELDYEPIDSDPSDGTLEIAPNDTPGAMPGVTFADHKVAAVRTRWTGAGVRQEIALITDEGEQAQSTGELLAQHIKKASENAVNYSQFYRSKVVKQDPDGTLHLMPDDPRVRGSGIAHVPILHGIPGLTVKVVPGTYVRLFFVDGSPAKPGCALWDDGSSVQSVALVSPEIKLGPTINPTQSAVRGEALLAYLDAVVNAVTKAIGAIPASVAGAPNAGGGPSALVLRGDLAGAEALKQLALSQGIKLD